MRIWSPFVDHLEIWTLIGVDLWVWDWRLTNTVEKYNLVSEFFSLETFLNTFSTATEVWYLIYCVPWSFHITLEQLEVLSDRMKDKKKRKNLELLQNWSSSSCFRNKQNTKFFQWNEGIVFEGKVLLNNRCKTYFILRPINKKWLSIGQI